MFWRTDSGSRLTSYPATCARPDVGLSRPQSMRIVVDLPAPFGPRKPKTSPFTTSRFSWSTATKSSNCFRRFSTTTELVGSGMSRVSATDRIDKQVFDSWLDLLNRVEFHLSASQVCLKLRNASGRIVNHNMQAVAG